MGVERKTELDCERISDPHLPSPAYRKTIRRFRAHRSAGARRGGTVRVAAGLEARQVADSSISWCRASQAAGDARPALLCAATVTERSELDTPTAAGGSGGCGCRYGSSGRSTSGRCSCARSTYGRAGGRWG